MRRHFLPILGATLIGVALIGAFTGAWDDPESDDWNWFGPMSGGGHMGRSFGGDDSGTTEPPIAGASEITVIGSEFAFSPDVVTATEGEPVNLTFVNEGRIIHDLSIAEFGIRLRADPGGQSTTGFTPDQVGTFDIVCTLPGHAGQGMVATLVVEDRQ